MRSVHTIEVTCFEQLDGEAARRRLSHLALGLGCLLLRQCLRGLRHLRVRRLGLLRNRGNGIEFEAVGLRAAFAFGLQRPRVRRKACRLITLRIERGHFTRQSLGAVNFLVHVCQRRLFLETGECAKPVNVPIESSFVKAALETVAKEGAQRLPLADAVQQPLGSMHPFGGEVHGKGLFSLRLVPLL